jgi:hypothetical protein
MDVLVKLRLQLTELLKRSCCQYGKVTGVSSQDLVAIRFQDALHPPHLLNGLVNLFRCLNHNRNRVVDTRGQKAGLFERRDRHRREMLGFGA